MRTFAKVMAVVLGTVAFLVWVSAPWYAHPTHHGHPWTPFGKIMWSVLWSFAATVVLSFIGWPSSRNRSAL